MGKRDFQKRPLCDRQGEILWARDEDWWVQAEGEMASEGEIERANEGGVWGSVLGALKATLSAGYWSQQRV